MNRYALAELPVPMAFATHRIIRDCNDDFTALFGFDRSEVVDRSFARLYPKLADFVRIGLTWKRNLTGQAVYHDERIMRDASGRRFWCQVSGRTLTPDEPLAEVLYCFQPLSRPVREDQVLLSDRQRQILTLVAQGKTNADISREIGLSRRTVEAHRARMMRAIGVGNAAELVAWFSAQPGGA